MTDAWTHCARFLVEGAAAPAAWRGSWIDDGGADRPGGRGFYLRKRFQLASPAELGLVHVSADSRYELWLNGHPIGRGPARWSVEHRVFETYALGELARAGENVFAARVVRWGEGGPLFDLSHRAGFLLESEAVVSDASWRARPSEAEYAAPQETLPLAVYVAGSWHEDHDARREPQGWTEFDHEDSEWAAGRAFCGARDGPWQLFPRALPAMEERAAEPLAPLARARVEPSEYGFATPLVERREAGALPLELSGDERAECLVFDAGRVVTGQLGVVVDAPAGVPIELMVAEALTSGGRKALRTSFEAFNGTARVEGLRDRYVTRGGGVERFEPFWHRAFRYVRLACQSAEPVRVHALDYRWSAYPATHEHRFACSDPLLEEIWQVGWETTRLCARETFEDTPYYEGLQYAADAHLQGLIFGGVTGDYRLMRNAIEQLAEPGGHEGFLPSRHPCREPQYLQAYPLFWVLMLEDYWMRTGEEETPRAMLPRARALLELYWNRRNEKGVLENESDWNFFDWSLSEEGVPNERGEACALSTWLYAWAAQALGRLGAGLEGEAGPWPKRAAALASACEELFLGAEESPASFTEFVNHKMGKWTPRPETRLYRNTDREHTESVQVNALAVASGLLPRVREQAIFERLEKGGGVHRVGWPFCYFLHRALARTGHESGLARSLRSWQIMLTLGATSWFETRETDPRSDCHGWSAVPTLDLPTFVLGVEPLEPGYSLVRVKPRRLDLEWARGSVPTPHGPVAVSWQAGERFELELSLPEGVRAVVELPGGSIIPCDAGRVHHL